MYCPYFSTKRIKISIFARKVTPPKTSLQPMQIIDGKATAAIIKAEIKSEVEKMVANGQRRPHLAAILVGHDGGSETYVRNKVLACEACGFQSSLIRYEDDITEAELLSRIDELNHDDSVDGFIVQLPNYHHPTFFQSAQWEHLLYLALSVSDQ